MSDLPDSETPLPGELPGLLSELPADDAATPEVPEAHELADPAVDAAGDPASGPGAEAIADDLAGAAPARAARPPAEAPTPRPSPTHVRAFLAVNFPVATVRRIADEAGALRGPVAAAGLSVKWVPAANLHLTLKFLGPVRVAAVEAIVARVGSGLLALGPTAARPFELEARGLGAFPSPEQPRILWAGVAPSTALAALQHEVEGWMADLGFPREERPFHPHVTLGRVTSGHGDLASLLAERADKSLGGGRVTEIVLYESRTLHKGAEYHALSRMPLLRT